MSDHIKLVLEEVGKIYASEYNEVEVLRDATFSAHGGESLAILGPSGCGKSTLLHIIGTLDAPTSGKVEINGGDPFQKSEPELAKFRNEVVGFVFQDHHLMPQYTVLENVLIPVLAFNRDSRNHDDRARNLLERVGLSHRLSHRPAELSGGERQRVAIARALINRPALLLCDEPTGNLDQNTADSVASLLFELHKEENNILIVVTHSPALAAKFDRRLGLQNGALAAVESE